MTVDRTASVSALVRTRSAIVVLVAFIGVCIALSGSGAAAPAAPTNHTLSQPDDNNTSFTATQWGTEDNHGWQTADGYTIVQGPDGWWWYATVEAGDVVPTDRKVSIDTPPDSVPKKVRGVADTSRRYSTPRSSSASGMSAQTAPADIQPAPTTGTVRYPVILITYPDTNTTASSTEFQQLLFGDEPAIGSGPGSMQDFYLEASNGRLHVDGSVSAWVTADRGHDYYDDEVRAAELVQEAVTKADDQIDYSRYDNNGDGYVDGVIVIHQGGGQEATGNPEDIWSHRWSLSSAAYYEASISPYASDNGVTINDYSINPETQRGQISTVGVFAHETGHLLGMTDLYDTDYSSEGIGEWGLMGGGSWNSARSSGSTRQGSSPAHPVAFHKWQQGWITPAQQPLTGPMGVLEPYSNTSDTFQWLDNPNGAEIGGTGEYFLATYRTQTGFDQGLPGEGVLITHVDESQTTNDNEKHKLVDIEAADGDRDLDAGRPGDVGDPFPTQGSSGFTPNTTPSSNLYNGSDSGLHIAEVGLQKNQAVLNPVPRVSIQPTGGLRFSLAAPNETTGTRTIENASTQTNNTVTISSSGTDTVTITNLSFTGANATSFTVQNTTNQTLNPGEEITRNITFASSTNGTYSATLVIEHTGVESPEKLSLIGTRGTAQLTDPTARALLITGRNSGPNLTQNDVTIAITRFERGVPANGIELTQNDITTIITLFERN